MAETPEWHARLAEAIGDSDSSLLNGDPTRFGFQIDSVTLRSGDTFALTPGGVTVIVGANNAGKSTVLRDLIGLLAQRRGHPRPETKSVAAIELTKSGRPNDLIAWVGNHYKLVARGTSFGFFHGGGVRLPQSLVTEWENDGTGIGPLSDLLAFYGDAQGRFGIAGAFEMRDAVDDPPTHPIHSLQDSQAKLDEINRVCRSVFGESLTLDALARVIRLRVGEVGMDAPPVDAVTPEYRKAMAALVPLDEQGDGMRSLMGLLLPLVTSSYPVIVIDEPEAFLHPPQAHALGRELGLLASKGRVQVVVATHDRNFLTGLLESGVDVSVARLSRKGSDVRAHQLNAADLRTLWTDPVLKYSNLLEGLFHRLVVLAEAEGDCNYLAAALESGQRPDDEIPRNEILFVPTGGKGGMPKAAKALQAVQVPVIAAPDLDILDDASKLKTLVEALGGEWSADLGALHAEATVDLVKRVEPATVQHVLEAITATLSGREGEPYTSEIRDQVKANLRAGASPWAAVKDHGMSAFKGQARAACEVLVDQLGKLGIVAVRDGVLEGLAPEVTNRKGPGWLQAALAVGAQANERTQAHLGRIIEAGSGAMEREARGPQPKH